MREGERKRRGRLQRGKEVVTKSESEREVMEMVEIRCIGDGIENLYVYILQTFRRDL